MNQDENKGERNTRVVLEIWNDFYNDGDVDAFVRNVTHNLVWKSDTLFPFPGYVVGVEQALSYSLRLSELLPGLYGQVLELTTSGDTVTLISHTHALQCRGYFGLPNINKPMQFHQIMFCRLTEQGRVEELWFFYDRAYILQQLGILPQVSVFGGSGGDSWFDFLRPSVLSPPASPASCAPSPITSEPIPTDAASLLRRLARVARGYLFGVNPSVPGPPG